MSWKWWGILSRIFWDSISAHFQNYPLQVPLNCFKRPMANALESGDCHNGGFDFWLDTREACDDVAQSAEHRLLCYLVPISSSSFSTWLIVVGSDFSLQGYCGVGYSFPLRPCHLSQLWLKNASVLIKSRVTHPSLLLGSFWIYNILHGYTYLLLFFLSGWQRISHSLAVSWRYPRCLSASLLGVWTMALPCQIITGRDIPWKQRRRLAGESVAFYSSQEDLQF